MRTLGRREERMRKTIVACALALAAVLAGCAQEADDILVIGDRFFVQQIDDIFINRPQNLGRTIRYEGVFRAMHWAPTDTYHFYVVRYVMSCCGFHAVGFELLPYNVPPLPDETWVEVTGVLEEDDGFIVIRVISLIETTERGAEVVDFGLSFWN